MKIWNSVFSIGQNFCSIDQNSKKIILEFLDDSIAIRFLFNRSTQPIETHKTEFSAEFFSDCFESLKRFQALWIVLWNTLTLHTCLLMKYNHMGINRDLCSFEKKLTPQNSKLERNTINHVVILQNCYL